METVEPVRAIPSLVPEVTAYLAITATASVTVTETVEPVRVTPAPEVARTRPPYPTRASVVASDAIPVGVCRETVLPRAFVPGQALYFRVAGQGWYRTADEFRTSEWVAPYGALSRDLKYLVTFDCAGPGTTCVASPPDSQPRVLSVKYEMDRVNLFSALWLYDNQRLVFVAVQKTASNAWWDVRLKVLDVVAERILDLARDSGSYEVSPAGDCVAFTAFSEQADDFEFQLASIESGLTQAVWRAPTDARSQVIWPRQDEAIAWSPDGTHLAYVKALASQIRVWEMATGRQQIFDTYLRGAGPKSVVSLRWSPDSKQIYFATSVSQSWILDLEHEQMRLVASERSSLVGQWLPDNRSVIVPTALRGSVILDTETGVTQTLDYPGSDKARLIDDLFW
jgi:WD40 repeat protein